MTEYIDDWKILNELVTKLRNADIFTTTQRSVTTTTDTGTFSSATTHLINKNDVRNIRSITVATVLLVYGTDYDIDYTYNDSGTIKTKITFTTAQTGAYSIQYDYGEDRIFTDWPQEYLTLSQFPRIGMDLMPFNTQAGGHGNVNASDVYFQITVYDPSTKKVAQYAALIRKWAIEQQTNLYYLKGPLRPHGKGATLEPEFGKNKVFSKAQEFVSVWNFEKNN